MRICACGMCGLEITSKNPNTKFISGHNTYQRTQDQIDQMSAARMHLTVEEYYQWKNDQKKSHYCECGCNHLTNVNRKYIKGHFNRNKPISQEAKSKMSVARKGIPVKQRSQKISIICECGCGNLTKPGNKFIFNHQNIGKRKYGSQLCKCGCGEEVAYGRKYINGGHWHRGRIVSDEVRKKISIGLSKNPKSAEQKENFRLFMIELWKSGHFDDVAFFNLDSKWSKPTMYNGVQMRSKLEARTAKILHENQILYNYEPKRYFLSELNTTYLPDFYLPEFNVFLDPKGRNENLDKIEEFRKIGNTVILVRDEDLRGLEGRLVFEEIDGKLTLLTQEQMLKGL